VALTADSLLSAVYLLLCTIRPIHHIVPGTITRDNTTFLTPTIETRFGDIVLAAHRLDGLTAIGLAQDANDFFGAVELFFRRFLREKVCNTLTENGANLRGQPTSVASKKYSPGNWVR
jgi:hypothetical protein